MIHSLSKANTRFNPSTKERSKARKSKASKINVTTSQYRVATTSCGNSKVN